jgi:hypothetical protein
MAARTMAPDASVATGPLALFPEAGFLVGLPAEWLTVELVGDADAAERFAEEHPDLAPYLAAFQGMGPMDTFGVAPIVPGDPFPAAFASFQGMSMGMSAEELLRLTKAGMSQVGVTGEVEEELLTIAGLPGYALGYDWALPMGDGTKAPVHVDQYTIVAPDRVLVFSVTDDAAWPDHGRALAS